MASTGGSALAVTGFALLPLGFAPMAVHTLFRLEWNMRGAAFSTRYTYDSMGRLQQGQTNDLTAANTWQLAWTYDRYGNRLSQTLTGGTMSVGQPQLNVDPATNHISSSGFAYDASGNLTQDPAGSYTFDADNRMTQSVVGLTTASYSYDGNRLRVQKTSGTTTTTYIFSGAKVIAEYVNGSLSKEYIYSAGKLISTVGSGNVVTYHHADHLSNRLETDAAGNVIRTFCNLPFGDIWYETGTAEKWKFATYERDPESTLDYAINRFYSSGYGRFTSVDLLPGILPNPQSLNRYSYVQNDPVDSVDPLGLDRCMFNIGIADDGAGLTPEQLAGIEARIDQIFSATDDNGNSVGATFDPKQKADYTLHFDPSSHTDDGQYIYGLVPPTVYTSSITRDYGAANFAIAAGTVGAHELYHNITHTFDQPYEGSPNLMNIDSAIDQQKAHPDVPIPGLSSDETNPAVTGFAKLTADQVKALFRNCQKRHKKKGAGGRGGGPKRNVPGDTGSGGPLSGDASNDPCPDGDCGPGSGWDPSFNPTDPSTYPTLHDRP